jgi:hypothetical protein
MAMPQRRKLLNAGLRMVLLGLALCALQFPVAAQNVWVYDASYVSYTDWDGGQLLEVWVEYDSMSYYDYAYFGIVWIPGLAMPAYYDCGCSYHSDAAYSGSWSFYASGPYRYSSTEWYYDLYWDLYAPTNQATECSGCLLCEDPRDESVYTDYYDSIWDWIAIVEY